MEVAVKSSLTSIHAPISVRETPFTKPKLLSFQFHPRPNSSISRMLKKTPSKSKPFAMSSPVPSSISTESMEQPEAELEAASQEEKCHDPNPGSMTGT